jgi:hypothetical protein
MGATKITGFKLNSKNLNLKKRSVYRLKKKIMRNKSLKSPKTTNFFKEDYIRLEPRALVFNMGSF